MRRWTAGADRFTASPIKRWGVLLDLPVDIQGTAFQSRVWRPLREIPLGQIVSYREIAEQVGAPNAARAVASACASNHVALLIPCHRVVNADGGLSGYRWGVNRKRKLLEREAKARDKEAA